MQKEISASMCTLLCVAMIWLVVGSGKVSAVAGVGDPAPNFTLTDAISGDTIILADYRDKVVLLDFFATYCYSCIQAFQNDLIPLYNQFYADDPWVTFFSIDIWDLGITAEELRNFAAYHGVEWPILMGSDSNVRQDYEVTCTPTIFIIDGDGVIRHRYNCGSPGAEILKEEIDVLRVRGDVDGDLDVDYDDFIVLAGAYGSCEGDPSYVPEADLNGDGCVDYDDFIIVAGNYGKTAS